MRYFLDISYLGTNYHGWQRQPNAIGVQQILEEKLFQIFRQPIETVASGRTDKGVHARQQIVHLDMDRELTDALIYKLNRILPHDISINTFYPVNSDAHARFDAETRTYQYFIHTQKNPFVLGQSYFFDRPLDLDKMNEAAAILLNHTNFECFSKVHTEVKTFECTIFFAYWRQQQQQLVFQIEANRFLRGMVRAIVGTLLPIGLGDKPVEWMEEVILSSHRSVAGSAAPADGLFLHQIKYPDNLFLE